MKLQFLAIIAILLASGCSKIDDYLLGQDNTPNPKPLIPFIAKIDLKPKWNVTLGDFTSDSDYLKLKPVLINNTFYIASTNGTLIALDRHSGKQLWKVKTKYGFISGPDINHNIMLFGSNNSELIALNLRDGSELWHKKVSGDIVASPVIIGNRVITKTIDGNLYAFYLTTGKEIWVSKHGAPNLVLKASASPAILNNKIALVGYSDGKLDAVDLNTGHVLWQKSLIYATGASDVESLVDIGSDLIIHKNVVFLGSYQGHLGAFSLEKGEFLWNKPISLYKNFTIQRETLYVIDNQDIIWSVNSQDGQIYWKQTLLKSRNLTEPVIQNHHLFIADKTG